MAFVLAPGQIHELFTWRRRSTSCRACQDRLWTNGTRQPRVSRTHSRPGRSARDPNAAPRGARGLPPAGSTSIATRSSGLGHTGGAACRRCCYQETAMFFMAMLCLAATCDWFGDQQVIFLTRKDLSVPKSDFSTRVSQAPLRHRRKRFPAQESLFLLCLLGLP